MLNTQLCWKSQSSLEIKCQAESGWKKGAPIPSRLHSLQYIPRGLNQKFKKFNFAKVSTSVRKPSTSTMTQFPALGKQMKHTFFTSEYITDRQYLHSCRVTVRQRMQEFSSQKELARWDTKLKLQQIVCPRRSRKPELKSMLRQQFVHCSSL